MPNPSLSAIIVETDPSTIYEMSSLMLPERQTFLWLSESDKPTAKETVRRIR